MKTRQQRSAIAWELIRRIDTVTLCTCAEVADFHRRAQAGEFDSIFDGEHVPVYLP